MSEFLPATQTEKKCLVMISWHFLDDLEEDIFGFCATRAFKLYI